jgi:hydrogenase expression/formation protein HypE
VKDMIILAHGAGGTMSHELVESFFVKAFCNPHLEAMEDSASLDLDGGRLAFTTDSFVVSPIFFPGGDIGKLAVCGTVNDLAVAGAVPRYLSLGLIIEEGLALSALQRIVNSIAATANEAGVQIVTGDTKVVNRGAADRIFINTSGIGVLPEGRKYSVKMVRPGDKVLINGYVGDHGIAVLSKREGLGFETDLESDCAPLGGLIAEMLRVCPTIRCMRDPTRGGVASTLNEIAGQAQVGIELLEESIPVRDPVVGACEMLGFDPLYVANEGKVLAFVPAEASDGVLKAMQAHPLGEGAAIIGTVNEGVVGRVTVRTPYGAHRILDMLAGDLLPRIC